MTLLGNNIEHLTALDKIGDYDGAYIPEGNQRLCKVVIDAKKSLSARLRLVLSKNLKHDTLNKTITKKLEILFGND